MCFIAPLWATCWRPVFDWLRLLLLCDFRFRTGVFAVRPGLLAGSATVTLVHGALLGCVAYATYDLTNQATLKNWSWTLTIADLIWGTVLSAVSAYIGYWVTSRISG